MFATFWEELGGRGAGVLFGLLLGSVVTWAIANWKRYKERQSILKGDARDTIVINHHLVETIETPGPDGNSKVKAPAVLRIRSLGQSELDRVVPNGHLARELLHRAFRVTEKDTLISMEGPEGSYLLETLTNWVSDRVANGPFDHDLYVMAPCCEPAGLAEHQPITIILISVADLQLFAWPHCRKVEVEHGSDGARILTLLEMARRYRREQDMITQMHREGKRTRHIETMYTLDLALDKRFAVVPVKEVPWGRFEEVLKQMDLE